MDETKIKGICKWFKNGWGFILGDDGKEYFCHFTAIKDSGFRTLSPEQPVEFIPSENEKGLVALEIEVEN